jgi:hypothetical protein
MKQLTTILAMFAIASLSAAWGKDALEEIFEQTYTVAPDATLSIKNTDGSIRIYASNDDQVRVQALKKAFSAERLKAIDVKVTASPNAVVIDTAYPPMGPKWSFSDRSGTVDYTLMVPQTMRITKADLVNGDILIEGLRGGTAAASVVNGRVTGHNCFGDLDFRVQNGVAEFFYDWWEQTPFVANASTVNAHIKAGLPPDSSFVLNATSESGNITHEFLKKTKINNGRETAARNLRAAIGTEAGPTFNLHTKSGGIDVSKSY